MASRDAELVIETWKFRERALPRVPPTGWATTDGLREAVCFAVACSVDGIEHVEAFSGPATERERFKATVTTDAIDDEHVTLVSPADSSTAAEAGTTEFGETTEQFDLDEALNRL